MIDKRIQSYAHAVADVVDGSSILLGGFGDAGTANNLIEALHEQGSRNLTIVANNAGTGSQGLAQLLASGHVSKLICSYPRSSDPSGFLSVYKTKQVELELVPQGTICERLRCAAAGLGGFYSPVSVGTRLAEGKEIRAIDGRNYVFEQPLRGDVALIKAHRGDRWGNLSYRKAARNFNPVMAMAAHLTIVEISEFVELGELDPELIVTPGIFVDRITMPGREA